MQLLQTLFMLVLVGVLAASVISVGIMALMQIARTRRLAGEADAIGMRFAPEDPFDAPRRYADFALVNNGHSPRASNVMYGRLGGRAVRAFDFRYEIGHGTRRVTRHYDVVVIETDSELPASLMWHQDDREFAPLAVRSGAQADIWSISGDLAFIEKARPPLDALAAAGAVSMQSCGTVLMLFAPELSRKEGYRHRISDAVGLMDVVDLPASAPQAG